MAVIISECYHKITLSEAQAFNKSGAIYHGPSLRLPFDDYNSSNAYLELTRDEELVISLVKAVRVK